MVATVVVVVVAEQINILLPPLLSSPYYSLGKKFAIWFSHTPINLAIQFTILDIEEMDLFQRG